jgi:hypothetical protein
VKKRVKGSDEPPAVWIFLSMIFANRMAIGELKYKFYKNGRI